MYTRLLGGFVLALAVLLTLS